MTLSLPPLPLLSPSSPLLSPPSLSLLSPSSPPPLPLLSLSSPLLACPFDAVMKRAGLGLLYSTTCCLRCSLTWCPLRPNSSLWGEGWSTGSRSSGPSELCIRLFYVCVACIVCTEQLHTSKLHLFLHLFMCIETTV